MNAARTFGLACILLAGAAAAAVAQETTQLYAFSMPGCRPCRIMEPDLLRLKQQGYPVTLIDCTQNPEWADRFQVTQTPTLILVQDQRIAQRISGLLNHSDLLRLFDSIGFRPDSSPTPTPANASAAARENRGENRWNEAHRRAYQATVRLRVEDPTGTSFGTGSVIHRHDDEYLVVTCGHIFRESNGRGTVSVDHAFASGQPQTARGELLDFDAGARDIALVVFRAAVPIDPVPIAPMNFPVQAGDANFSVGCDHGNPPTLHTTSVKRVANYDGARKYDTVGRPVDGRSGGGLFSAGGQLIGVCNAAAVEVDEGVFTSLDNIYWQFDRSQIAHLFHPSQPVADSHPTRIASNVAPQHNATPPLEPLVDSPSPPSVSSQADQELIVVVRSKNDPSNVQTFTIDSPSVELLQAIAASRQPSGERTAWNRDNFPLPPESLSDNASRIRGQSVR